MVQAENKPTSITRDLIFKAADEIAAEGRQPTIEAVKELLASWTGGKGGSYATLSPAMRDWKSKARKQEQEIDGVKELPISIGEQLSTMAARIWADALDAANSRFSLELEESKQIQSETIASLVEAESMIGRQEERLEGLEADVVAEREKTGSLAATIEELRRQVEQEQLRASDEIAKAKAEAVRQSEIREAAQVGLAKAELRLEAMPKLEAEIAQLRQALDTERAARSAAEAKAAGAEAKATGLADRLNDCQADAAKAAAVAEARLAQQISSCAELTGALRTEVATWKEKLREAVASLTPATPTEKPAE